VKLFKTEKYKKTDDVARLFATICCYKKRLPQGAPTSPVLSNMVAERLDSELIVLSIRNKMYYSRYADDLTFSVRTRNDFPQNIVRKDGDRVIVGDALQEIIKRNGFIVNPEKVRIATNKQRQIVAGLVVNKKCNVKRNYVRRIRSIIHDIDINGYERAQDKHYSLYAHDKNKEVNLEKVIDGMVAYLIMVKGKTDDVCVNMYSRLSNHFQRYATLLKEVNDMKDHKDFFLCHASEDKAYVKQLFDEILKNKHSAWLDEYEINIGDSIFDKVNEGLKCSDHGVVIISKSFFEKHFPETEMKNIFRMKKRVMPIFLNCKHEDFEEKYPILGDYRGHHSEGIDAKGDADVLCKAIEKGSPPRRVP
jgi:RNA-directed DNA polymerase